MTSESVPQKRCNLCGQEFPGTPEYFFRDKSKKDGLDYRCKPCGTARARKYYREHTEERRAHARKYGKAHYDSVKKVAAAVAWGKANPDKRRETCRRYVANNPDKVRASKKRYEQNNLDRKRTNVRRRRARLAGAGGNFTLTDVEAQYLSQEGKCHWCKIELNRVFEIDHIIPVSKGGTNDPGNICCACKSCNRRKSNKHPDIWINEI